MRLAQAMVIGLMFCGFYLFSFCMMEIIQFEEQRSVVKKVPCYDSQDNEIIGLTCRESIIVNQYDKNVLITILFISLFLIYGPLIYLLWGRFND